MTAGDPFRRLEELFFELADLEPEVRAARLEEIRGTDPELAASVAGLLERDEAGDRVVGPYRLLRRLGAGGMGEVWEAEQTEPVHRRVAVKLLRPGLAVGEALQRFRAEREAMARLSHPGIARVLDAGVAADGRPYVVMELVDGEPITGYCDRRALPLPDRLRLVVDVCRAVQHAHQKGVIHRDLKPSNVLVVERDGQPRPIVIDFGIARALAAEDVTRVTRHGDVLGTVGYMSPEQASGDAAAVDTRSDVYALGVLMYELLTGQLPLPVEGSGDDRVEVALRRILEQDPVPPSERVRTAGRDDAHACADTPDPRGLRGDLDWIVMKALAKAPEERYASASELAADIERHLRDEPVLAGPPSVRYRFAKLVRRHRAAVVASAVVAVAVAAGIVGTTLGMVRALRAEADAVREAAVSEQVAGFLVDLFRSSDPARAQGADVTARELLEDGAATLGGELEDAPAVRARLLRTLGQVHNALGEHSEALGLLTRAIDAEVQAGPNAEEQERALTLVALGRAHRGLDDLDSAATAFDEAETLLARSVGDDDPALLPVLRERANLAITRGDHRTARARLEQAAEIAAASPDSTAEEGRILAEIAFLDYQQGDFRAARDRFAASLSRLRDALGTDHPDVADALNDLAVVEKRLGNYEVALELYERGLEVSERVLGDDHPAVGDLLHNMSRLLLALGRSEEATAASERALAVQEAARGPGHRMVTAVLGGLGDALATSGNLDGARSAYRDGLARMRDRPERFYGYLPLSTSRRLAALERRSGHAEDAARVCREALAGPAANRYDRHRALVELELAAALVALGDRTSADRIAEEALAVLDADDADDPWAASLHRARYRHVSGDDEAARRALDRALALGADPGLVARDPDLNSIRTP